MRGLVVLCLLAMWYGCATPAGVVESSESLIARDEGEGLSESESASLERRLVALDESRRSLPRAADRVHLAIEAATDEMDTLRARGDLTPADLAVRLAEVRSRVLARSESLEDFALADREARATEGPFVGTDADRARGEAHAAALTDRRADSIPPHGTRRRDDRDPVLDVDSDEARRLRPPHPVLPVPYPGEEMSP